MNAEHKLTRQIEDFIAFKRGMGYLIIVEAAELRRFGRFAKARGHQGSLTADLALDWAAAKSTYSRWYKARRLETVSTFARFALAFDPETQMPPAGVFGRAHLRTSPYIYTENEVVILMQRAKQLLSPDGLRGIAVSTVLGLLWATGIRVSEACRLSRKDVHYQNSELHIRDTKFHKERIIPLHPTVVRELKRYEEYRNKLYPNVTTPSLFLSTGGEPLSLRNLEYGFTVIRHCLLPEDKLKWNRRPPRLYDLRHSFASHTILRWVKEGVDVNHRINSLSTYLGHVKPSDTYWYLTGTPELLAIATEKFENLAGRVGATETHV